MIEDLKAIAIYVKVVECGSFREAAKALQLSPSVVSYQISQLENKYTTMLLYRSTRKLSVTTDGKVFFETAQKIIENAELALNVLAKKSLEPSGYLKISIPASMTQSNLMRHISDFALNYPNIELSITASDQRVDVIGDGYDIAIRAGQMQDSSLKSKKIGDITRKLVAAPDLLKSRTLPLAPTDIAAWPWVHMSMMPEKRKFTNKQTGQDISINVKDVVHINNIDGMHQLTLGGVGISSPPSFVADDAIQSGMLVELLTDWQIPSMPVYAVWPPNSLKNSLSSLFLKHIKNYTD